MEITKEDIDTLIKVARIQFTKGNQAWAEDLVQTTLLKVWKVKDRYEERGQKRSYLIMILRNTFINEYRKQRYQYKGRKKLSQVPLFMTTSSQVHLDQRFEPEIQNSLGHMPEGYMDVLLARTDGLSYKEIAEEQNIPMGTVMSRLYRARKCFIKSTKMKNMSDYYERFPQAAL